MNSTLLDELSKKCHCFISDLKYNENPAIIQSVIHQISLKAYTIEEWNYCLSYLFEKKLSFENYFEISQYLSKII